MRLERDGKVIVVSIDEKYYYERHISEYSLLLSDGNGKAKSTIKSSNPNGRRVCIIGEITEYGPVVTIYPGGHSKAGETVID